MSKENKVNKRACFILAALSAVPGAVADEVDPPNVNIRIGMADVVPAPCNRITSDGVYICDYDEEGNRTNPTRRNRKRATGGTAVWPLCFCEVHPTR